MSGREDLAGLVETGRRMSPRLDMMDCETVLQMADAIEALAAENARLAASEPQCAVVKPLVWEHFTLTQTWQAKSIFGEYAVGFDDGWWAQLDGYANWEWSAPDDPRSYHGPDAAKAAAQADYEARILSAITLRPEAEVSAEAWAAAIEAAAVKMAKGGLHTVFDRSEAIRALQQPADISAALDRIKAEAKAEGMRIGASMEKMRALTEWLSEDEDNGELLMASIDAKTVETLRAILAAIPEVRK